MPIYKCSYAEDISCYADFTIEAASEQEAEDKLTEMLARGCFRDVPTVPCYENGSASQRVFVSSETDQHEEPLDKLEGFNPDANEGEIVTIQPAN